MNPRSTLGEPAVPVTAFMQIDAACDRFEADYRAGRSPDLAAYLAGVPEEVREPLFRNLLAVDLEYRLRRGERPDAAVVPRAIPRAGRRHRFGVPLADRSPGSERRPRGRSRGRRRTRSTPMARPGRSIPRRTTRRAAAARGGLDGVAYRRPEVGRLRGPSAAGTGRHGRGLRGAPGRAQPPGGAQADPVGELRLGVGAAAVPERGRGGRAARPSAHRADLRGRPPPRPPLLQHEADRREQPGQAARRVRRRPPRRGPAGRRHRRGDPSRPPARHPPPRPEAGQYPARRAGASRTSPTSAWPSGSTATPS